MRRLSVVALAYLWSTLLVSCGGVPPIQDPAGYAQCLLRCQAPGFCAHGAEGWACITPQPSPSPSASPTPAPTPSPCVCPLPGGGTYPCADPYCRCGSGACPVPTPSPTATPTPQPTAVPTPAPTPTPCVPGSSVQRVCVNVDGSTFPYTANACWDCTSWTGYMVRNGYFTAGDPKEDGDAAGRPGFWLNYDPQQVLVGLIRKSDCAKVDPRNGNVTGVAIDPPYMEKRTVVTPCPSPSPGPTPSPSPSVPPNPGAGLKCAPLDSIGVAFHAQHPAPHGPLGYRWVFSATPKSVKPFCPEHRNECEQQAYIGDPVANYDAVAWRFDERFRCQDPAGPLWNQQEPHTGQSWEPTDVRQENNYLANLKPAVKGKHVVRTCRRDAPTVCRYAEKVAN
jgi:hypothetical protein